MISKKAITQFLDRDLANYDWVKSCTNKELDEALNDLNPIPYFHTPQWQYQKAVFLLCHELERFMAMLDLGLGKTKICLDLINYDKQCGKEPRAIVFVPYITAVETWIEETEKHAPDLTCIPLTYGSQSNLDLLANEPGDLFVVQFQTAAAMLTQKKQIEGKSKKKTKWDLNTAKVRKVFKDFDQMIIDESQKIANIHSLYYRIARAIGNSPNISKIYELTGTPFGSDPTYLWAQFNVLDQGETLGETLGLFRAAFFHEEENYWGGYKYKFDKRKKKLLYKIIKNRSVRYLDSECDDIPKKRSVVKLITFPASISKYYKKANDDLKKLAKGKKKNFKEIKSTIMQLMQLSSGFITFKEEEGDKKVKIKFQDNPKLEALLELIDTIPKNRKFVIFHFFTHSNEVISEALTKAGINHARVYGKSEDPIGEIRRFKADNDCRGLVINSKSGSSSLNLQVANYVIWYELPLSLIDFKQAIKRCWRRGQTRRVYFFYLLVKGTYDQKMYKNLKSGNDLFTAILDGRTKL